MKRKELFEFEDYSWFPASLRSGMTNLIMVLHKMMGTTQVLANLISEFREKNGFDTIVDLGSGSGGPMPNVIKVINEESQNQPLKLLLTDLHPNPKTVEKFNNDGNPNVNYNETSIDAVNIGEVPKGLKTMIASFHHMSPQKAKEILKSASESGQPIFFYEIAKNNIPFVVWLLLLPISLAILIIMVWFMTPFSKSLTLTQVLFTYLIPIIPIAYAWDGQASLMRTYTFSDIQELLEGIDSDNYHWQVKDAIKDNGKKLGYYVMGHPIN